MQHPTAEDATESRSILLNRAAETSQQPFHHMQSPSNSTFLHCFINMLHRISDYAKSHLMLLLIWLIFSNALLCFLDDSLHSPVSSIVSIRGGLRQQQLNDVPVLLCCSSMDGLLASCILCIGISTPLCNARPGVSAMQDLVSVQTKCSSNHSAGCGLSILCIGISTSLCNEHRKVYAFQRP